MARTYLSGIFSVETALLQDYPFGNGRCVRRVWFEQAAKGAAKGSFRQCAQTTTKAFNAQYNAKIDELKIAGDIQQARQAALVWAIEQGINGRQVWNAVKCSTYCELIAPYLNENEHIEFDTLSVYSTAEKFVEFRTAWIDTGILRPDHINIYESLERFNRRQNPRCWAKFIDENGYDTSLPPVDNVQIEIPPEGVVPQVVISGNETVYCDPRKCTMIQWEQDHIRNGVPSCPRCGREAEKCLGFFGNPCWAHKIETKETDDAV